MPPAAKKDYGIIVFDVASSKKQELLGELIKFTTFKWFMNSRSVYELVLVNSAKTSNHKNYPGIFVSKIDYDPKSILALIENADIGKSDWLDALLLGMDFLKEGLKMPGLITLQLIYFTSLDSSSASTLDRNKIAQITSELNENNLYFYLIGPTVKLPFTITNVNSIPKCMKQLQVDNTNKNLVAAKNIVSEVKTAVMCEVKLGLHLLTTFKNSPGTQPWKVPMTIGTQLSIPACTGKIYRKDTSLKLQLPGKRTFSMTSPSDSEVKLEEGEYIRGLVLHKKLVQFEERMFGMETTRCFEIIGFSNKKFIPEPYLSGTETYYVLPNESTDDGFQMFTHLVNVLQETNKYGIIKRVYAAGNKPRYFVLIPNIDYTPKCFAMVGIPPGDNLIPHKYKIPNNKVIEEDGFSNFFKSLIVDDTKGQPNIPLGPTLTMDYYQQKLINATATKYLEQDLCFEDVNSEDDNLETDQELQDFKESWPERSLN